MSAVEALNSENITKIGLVVIGALILIGALLSIVITKLIGRLVILIVVVVLGVLVWQQRTHVEDKINKNACGLNTTFFGIHLDAPAAVRQACQKHT